MHSYGFPSSKCVRRIDGGAVMNCTHTHAGFSSFPLLLGRDSREWREKSWGRNSTLHFLSSSWAIP